MNFEHSKLPIPYPTLQNFLILFIIFGFTLLLRKREATTFLDRTQTDQLKGIAIILVVVGHLWVHVSEFRAYPVLGDYAVTLFLFLSGYGLSKSYTNRDLFLKEFILKRLSRVIIPYWTATIVFIFLDYTLLNKVYSEHQIILTAAGINVSQALMHIDYTRWFITLLLTYYLIFGIIYNIVKGKRAAMILLLFGLVIAALRVPKFYPTGNLDQIFAFPLGCLLVAYHDNISRFIRGKWYPWLTKLSWTGLALLSLILTMSKGGSNYIQKILFSILQGMDGLLFCMLLISIFLGLTKIKFTSSFLKFCGSISYEIYLIHGPFLIKFNPIMGIFPPATIYLTFFLFLLLILGLAYSYSLINISFSRVIRLSD
jgi:peptidoglycan/LPS O-acetylase OafA/YrhL